jgi:hypothetical protein
LGAKLTSQFVRSGGPARGQRDIPSHESQRCKNTLFNKKKVCDSMTIRFHGTLPQLVEVMARSGIRGEWEQEPNGVVMMRCANGANVHWSTTRKTLWFDGCAAGRQQLLACLEKAVGQIGEGSTALSLPD